MTKVPHPIPYQGSKRALAPVIARYMKRGAVTFFEPFAGSAAMTIYAANLGYAERYVIADVLPPIVELWRQIVTTPEQVSARYEEVWRGQLNGPADYFNQVRERFNAHGDPIDLLYLVARCVKNAVRFNAAGRFTQSVDKRRLGMNPSKMATAVLGCSNILRSKVEFRCGDWRSTISDATSKDLVYLDPPYFGTTEGRDKRYASQLKFDQLCAGLEWLNDENIPFLLSYDGMTGDKSFAPPLPQHLEVTQILINAGRSSQATLNGEEKETIESLYIAKTLQIDSHEPRVAFVKRKQPLLNL